MKAWILSTPGDSSGLSMQDIPGPEVSSNTVLVAVKAVGINPIDIKTRLGKGLYGILKNETPLILGWDISGIVIQVGNDVADFKKGDEVFGMINFPGHGKAYAEFVAAPAAQLSIKPSHVSHQEAAAASLAALTAWQALTIHAKIQKGQRVLIHTAAGGVGHYAVQIAKHFSAWVAGSSSAANKEFILDIGADKHIDYNAAPLTEQVSDIDFVLDTVGGSTIDQSLAVMKKGGTIVSIPSATNESVTEKAAAMGMQGFRFLVKSNGANMKMIADLLAQGFIKSHVSRVFPFSDLQKAHAQIETGRTRGKVVVSLP